MPCRRLRPGEEGAWQRFHKKIGVWKNSEQAFGFRDGWAIGLTPQNEVAVWWATQMAKVAGRG